MSRHYDKATSGESSPSSAETKIPIEVQSRGDHNLHNEDNAREKDDFSNLNFPPAWKFEKWFVGGYSQKRMLKFKNPKSMYMAINLFAGRAV